MLTMLSSLRLISSKKRQCPPINVFAAPLGLSYRNKHFVVSSMKDLFENVASQNIVDFIKDIHFYKQL